MIFISLCVMVGVAFFPDAAWLKESRLPKQFFGALHLSTHVTPGELADRVRQGFHRMELESHSLAHPDSPSTER
jgi:hypothetical protein